MYFKVNFFKFGVIKENWNQSFNANNYFKGKKARFIKFMEFNVDFIV